MKIIIRLLCFSFALLLCGCGANNPGETQTSSEAINETTSPEISVSSEATTTPTETISLHKSFGLSLEEFGDLIGSAQTIDRFVTYETSDFTIHREGSGSYGILCFSSPGSTEIEVAIFLAYSGASRTSAQTKAAIESQNVLIEYCKANSIPYLEKESEVKDKLVFMVAAKDSSLIGQSLPLSVQKFRSSNEFLSDPKRLEKCKLLLKEFRYAELLVFIDEFAENNDVLSNDIIFDLQKEVSCLVDLVTECEIIRDDVEDIAHCYSSNIRCISEECCVVPYLSTSNYGISIEFQLGFIRDGWLFFDTLIVSNSNGETDAAELQSHDVVRDIIRGSLIQESITTSRFRSSFSPESEDEIVTLRFKCSDSGEYFDHVLTSDETTAVKILTEINALHSSIYYAIDNWEDA